MGYGFIPQTVLLHLTKNCTLLVTIFTHQWQNYKLQIRFKDLKPYMCLCVSVSLCVCEKNISPVWKTMLASAKSFGRVPYHSKEKQR